MKSEKLQNAFLFFQTQIAIHDKSLISKDICLRIAKQLIDFNKTLYSLPKKELLELVPDTQLARKVKDRTSNIYTYLIKKNEKDLIQILVRFQDSLQPNEI